MTPTVSFIRRKYLTNPPFQLRFLAFSGLSAIGACTFFYAANAYFFYQYTGYAIDAGLSVSHPFFKVLMNMEDLMTWIFAITSVLTLLFTVVAGLMFSNRVAGPITRMRGHFERVARGESLDGISFRQGDYFDDLADSYNRQMDTIRRRLAKVEGRTIKPPKRAA